MPDPTYVNPVLPGCHPDPSICRVGEEYFLATSSFGYHPGLPIHRSRDLVTWELVGHALEGEHVLARTTADGSRARVELRSDGRRDEALLDGHVLAAVPHRELSAETSDSFVGVLLGLTRQGREDAPPAVFTGISYDHPTHHREVHP